MGPVYLEKPTPKDLNHIGFSVTFIACGINKIASVNEQLHPNSRFIIEKPVQLAPYVFSLALII